MSKREANQQRVDAAAQRVRQAMDYSKYLRVDTFRKDVELLIEIALAPVLEIFAPAAKPMASAPSKRAIRRAWDFCKEYEHSWEEPCTRCLSLAEAFESFTPQSAAAPPQRESEIPADLIEELDRQVHGNDSGWHACVLCGCPERGAHFPACIVAKMRQRETP